jgi:hypothetical protein
VLEQLALARESRLHPGGPFVVDALGSLADGQALEDGPRLQDLDRFLVADLSHARAPVGLTDDEPFLLETDERRSHRAARHLERLADVRFD